jgi:hypothetical protein
MAKKIRSSSVKSSPNIISQIKNQGWGESRAYLVEYALLLVVIGAIVSIVAAFMTPLLKSEEQMDDFSSIMFGVVSQYNVSLGLISALVVLVPLSYILIQRTAESEAKDKLLKNLGWRKAFLGVFLFFVVVNAVVSAIMFVYVFASYIGNPELGSNSLNWRLAIDTGLTTILFVLTGWVFGYDYRSPNSRYGRLQHYYRYGLIAVPIIVAALFIIFPVREQRNEHIDNQIVNDLYRIQAMVSEYQVKNNKLPDNLHDMDLNTELKRRAEAYAYSYEQGLSSTKYTVCAVFKTDGSNNDKFGGIRPMPALDSPESSSPTIYPPSDYVDIHRHKAGRDCFEQSVYFFREPYMGEKEMPAVDLPAQTSPRPLEVY